MIFQMPHTESEMNRFDLRVHELESLRPVKTSRKYYLDNGDMPEHK